MLLYLFFSLSPIVFNTLARDVIDANITPPTTYSAAYKLKLLVVVLEDKRFSINIHTQYTSTLLFLSLSLSLVV